jgi:aminopeptidase N
MKKLPKFVRNIKIIFEEMIKFNGFFYISLCFLILIFLSSLIFTVMASNKFHENEKLICIKKNEWELEENVLPYHYNLTIYPNFEKLSFEGRVQIQVLIQNKTSCILLNSEELRIKSIEIYSNDEKYKNKKLKYTLNEKNQIELKIFEKRGWLSPNNYTIEIGYSGKISTTELNGFYRQKYENQSIYLTQLEPNYGRRLFPSFDEPKFKSKYTIIIGIKEIEEFENLNYNVYSNMEIEKIYENENKTKFFEFKTTPPISSYLVSFIIGEFFQINETLILNNNNNIENNENNILNKKEIKIRCFYIKKEIKEEEINYPENNKKEIKIRCFYIKKEIKEEEINYPINLIKNLTKLYSNYFEYNYPLNKLDVFSIPK